MLQLYNIFPIERLKSRDSTEISTCNIKSSLESLVVLAGFVETLRCLLGGHIRFVHLVERDTEHGHVEEYNLGEVLYAFVEGQVIWN